MKGWDWFWRFDWNHLGIKGQNVTALFLIKFLLCIKHQLDCVSILAPAVLGLTSVVISSCNMWHILNNYLWITTYTCDLNSRQEKKFVSVQRQVLLSWNQDQSKRKGKVKSQHTYWIIPYTCSSNTCILHLY